MSEAITFKPTAVIHGPPNDIPSITSETLATSHEARVSIDRTSVGRVSMGRAPLERVSVLCVVKPSPGGLALSDRAAATCNRLGPGEFEVLLCTQR